MKEHSWKSWECTTTEFFFERCLEITILGRYLCMEFRVTCEEEALFPRGVNWVLNVAIHTKT